MTRSVSSQSERQAVGDIDETTPTRQKRDIHGYRVLIVCLVIFWPLMLEACGNTNSYNGQIRIKTSRKLRESLEAKDVI
ncbi:hypothetical protein HGM15179_008714 [Zosterops borbonicus]|uniref:Uncharacterized protein n=1 Tax=Zosterops borbonicus TaxID=364589 RepID=A0A8K1LLP6_9PASS|nr:hypothetical protein HGM15179_008714 [Zosterops borbonicus]